ncbi:MAG: Re/Si-specific NAD(P)(+) transhydrogenase subunit alpha [Bacteroidetes Order II. Incertae sedis bacterium]|jgi:H+-translocating NAD(P) transhydrogenase subunit alpha|nr:Re/Si-specific NAD(P)(+) transhydrogenase subunit alpha [Bacteroidetes Order II. bacterium]MDG1755013.1 Re/Si-specific NAD(P)(+) transhydrogenase subunit alpha [Rhodothermales bacterium]MBT5251000.1 Re/Si-specific NAD(P)(+) transhydrogenase subunit alpha [Bacteroidetes Order II. bacterium]MBT6425367.1 Re/Si-specific NAD(P)(+) transhydrogenase subunit alpha [Bacteroidetes Order II. bacterium]MBT6598182.1 Re/Si-specific NAD(P)(+) transhydrogenase subunit alpha [Bacteroidetes Order II. bacteriu
MAYTIGVPKETASGERLVALIPEVVARLVKAGATLNIEAGAGESAHYSDAAFEKVGASLVSREAAFSSDIVVKVQPPSAEEIGLMKDGGAYIGFMKPLDEPDISARMAAKGLTSLSMEMVPRISRAQKMDALSALSSIGGYRAVLLAATELPKFFPLLTTAAGTVRPANVLILGAGVAGLQAIATARRLGSKVSAYDIREAVAEEVQSLGASFVELEIEAQDDSDSGGYAKALVAEKAKQQTKLLVPFIGGSDVVVATALIPGRKAPILITEEAVKAMGSGSIIVDMAASNGGNCELTEPGQTVVRHGVTIMGPTNLTSGMAVHASQLYSKTLLAMLQDFTDENGFAPNDEDEVFTGSCVTRGGQVVNERVNGLLNPAPAN